MVAEIRFFQTIAATKAVAQFFNIANDINGLQIVPVNESCRHLRQICLDRQRLNTVPDMLITLSSQTLESNHSCLCFVAICACERKRFGNNQFLCSRTFRLLIARNFGSCGNLCSIHSIIYRIVQALLIGEGCGTGESNCPFAIYIVPIEVVILIGININPCGLLQAIIFSQSSTQIFLISLCNDNLCNTIKSIFLCIQVFYSCHINSQIGMASKCHGSYFNICAQNCNICQNRIWFRRIFITYKRIRFNYFHRSRNRHLGNFTISVQIGEGVRSDCRNRFFTQFSRNYQFCCVPMITRDDCTFTVHGINIAVFILLVILTAFQQCNRTASGITNHFIDFSLDFRRFAVNNFQCCIITKYHRIECNIRTAKIYRGQRSIAKQRTKAKMQSIITCKRNSLQRCISANSIVTQFGYRIRHSQVSNIRLCTRIVIQLYLVFAVKYAIVRFQIRVVFADSKLCAICQLCKRTCSNCFNIFAQFYFGYISPSNKGLRANARNTIANDNLFNRGFPTCPRVSLKL